MSREKDIEEGIVPLGTNIGGDTPDDIDEEEDGTTQIDDADDVTNSELDATSPYFTTTPPSSGATNCDLQDFCTTLVAV